MDKKKIIGLAAASKIADIVPRRRTWWQRATDPANLGKVAAYGTVLALATLIGKKLYDRLRRPVEESIEHGRQLSTAVSEIADAAKATTDAAEEADSNAGKAIAAVEELGRQLSDEQQTPPDGDAGDGSEEGAGEAAEGSSEDSTDDPPEKG